MYIKNLSLENFRSYEKREFDFDSKTNLIVGENGIGKTNLLEAIYCLSTGKSFRSSGQSKLINWSANYAIIRAIIAQKEEENELEIQYTTSPELNSKTIRRKFIINKVEKTRSAYLASNIKSVIFHPDDIRLVSGSPSRRRDFLDDILSQIDWRYSQAVSQYNRALKHRNELLDQIKIGQNSRTELFYWDKSIIKNSEIIYQFRLDFFKFINNFLINHQDLEIKKIFIKYYPSVITQSKLDNFYPKDLACGYTQIGPHRDDFSFNNQIFKSEDKNLSDWGSRGQQRLAVLAVRLAQINFIDSKNQSKPILLLDDIFSELDQEHQKLVFNICKDYQTFYTSTEDNNLTTGKIHQVII